MARSRPVSSSVTSRAGRLAVLGCRMLLVLAAVGTSVILVVNVLTGHHPFMYDFRGGLYNAGTAILHGHDPYRPAFLAHQAAIMRAGGVALGETTKHSFSIPLYPAPANLAIVPLSLLPFWLASVLFTLLSVAAVIWGLWLLDVRDWRCFVVVLLAWPMLFSLDLGGVSPLLMLGVAVVWRYRDRLWPPAIALAVIVVGKVFPWTLGVWLLITKRYRTLALSVAIGAGVTLVAWAAIGFAGLTQYPQMLANASFIQEGRATSLTAVLLATGMSAGMAQAAALAVGVGLLGLAWRISRRPGGEREAFGVAVIAMLTASPIVWDHYMVLLFVPVALIAPRFSELWLLPTLGPLLLAISAAVTPITENAAGVTHDVRAALVWIGLQAVILMRLCWARSPRTVRSAPGVAAPERGLASPDRALVTAQG